MVGKPRKIFLGDDVVIARRRRVETVEDNSDEQVHEYVRDRQREAFVRVPRTGSVEAIGQSVKDRGKLSLVSSCRLSHYTYLVGYDPEGRCYVVYFRFLETEKFVANDSQNATPRCPRSDLGSRDSCAHDGCIRYSRQINYRIGASSSGEATTTIQDTPEYM